MDSASLKKYKKKTDDLTCIDRAYGQVTAQETRANVSLEITYQCYVEIASMIQNNEKERNHLVTICRNVQIRKILSLRLYIIKKKREIIFDGNAYENPLRIRCTEPIQL